MNDFVKRLMELNKRKCINCGRVLSYDEYLKMYLCHYCKEAFIQERTTK